MKKSNLFLITIFLIGAIVRFSSLKIASTIRTVDFIQIFCIGLYSGILLVALILKFKNRV